MDYKAVLEQVVQSVEGSIGIGLVGLDGLVIEQVSVKSDFDINEVGVEYSGMLKSAQKSSLEYGLGATLEVLITTEKAIMIMMSVADQYFVSLALSVDGNLGRARLEMKKAIPKLAEDLA